MIRDQKQLNAFVRYEDYPPHLNVLAISPGPERKRVWNIQLRLSNIRSYVRSFASSCSLIDFCEAAGPWPRNPSEVEAHEKYTRWINIAARDAIMQVYHFNRVWHSIRRDIKHCPTLYPLIDLTSIRRGRELFDKYFGEKRSVDARDAIAHAGELTSSIEDYDKNAFSGDYSVPGIHIAGSKGVSLQLGGRVQTVTFENRIITAEVSNTTLEQLVEVREAIYDAFMPTAVAFHGKDLGD